MRLVDLAPTWIYQRGRVVGLRFFCPINDGSGPHMDGHQVTVLFANPPDGGEAHFDDAGCSGNNDGRRWMRVGSSFDSMTLSPSIDCTTAGRCPKSDHSMCSHAHCWHGLVIDGGIQ